MDTIHRVTLDGAPGHRVGAGRSPDGQGQLVNRPCPEQSGALSGLLRACPPLVRAPDPRPGQKGRTAATSRGGRSQDVVPGGPGCCRPRLISAPPLSSWPVSQQLQVRQLSQSACRPAPAAGEGPWELFLVPPAPPTGATGCPSGSTGFEANRVLSQRSPTKHRFRVAEPRCPSTSAPRARSVCPAQAPPSSGLRPLTDSRSRSPSHPNSPRGLPAALIHIRNVLLTWTLTYFKHF